ncbi:putative ammonium transporter 3 [Schistocerca serialis cubense]|uniref:putative ammonium transporter 3 n=1 Tax=Schistocerca serialis cubense TaxID=2023355 RepID=UPI00214EFA29|nr:putative ammonium transporter 3 [Schistocerca serialis cubense]
METNETPCDFVNRAYRSNSSHAGIPGIYDLTKEDANWLLTSSFIIFTMQTGFGMLESGCVSTKNEVNIMMKNVADVVLGGFSYWLFGFGLSFGRGEYTTPFMGVGEFLLDADDEDTLMGPVMAAFLFQLSFATTATTIVSGAMAERCKFKSYCVFSFLNTVVYCIPAGWIWGEHGFLYNLGVVDIAGSGPVHLIGGSSALMGAVMLGPRQGRYSGGRLPMGSPVNAVMGLFVLWWGWLAFNSGSTFGLSGSKWQYSARAAVITILSSFGGGLTGLMFSLLSNRGQLHMMELINSILGALVSVTAGCFLYRAWEAIVIGLIGGLIVCCSMPLFDKLKIDDPVGATSVHGMAAIWGVLAVGLFAEKPVSLNTTHGRSGLLKGGGWYMLGVQLLSVVCLVTWGITTNFLLLFLINKMIGLRMDPSSELAGADITEHGVYHTSNGITFGGKEIDKRYNSKITADYRLSKQKLEDGDNISKLSTIEGTEGKDIWQQLNSMSGKWPPFPPKHAWLD